MKKAAFLLLLLLGGCFQKPFVDSRREAGSPYTVGESKPDRVAICYNSFSTNANEIIKMAQEECQKTNREAAYDGHKYWSCRVFFPHRVYFRCQDIPTNETQE
ncbi:MAG: hypothetical protein J5787_01710 [Alphaproteobacteria bacterium]|nr:hypothetical protein [Alphaproteobacteria bacterium]MBO4644348.1 hypothetical protein [Alphaproteobacteria bacterium]